MRAVIFDTETTGLTKLSFANAHNFKQWPRMVQIAWAVLEDDEISEQYSAIIRPDGYTIPASAAQLHGISQVKAENAGVPIEEVLHAFQSACAQAQTIIAHHLLFDLGVVMSESLRQETKIDLPGHRICTMHAGRTYLAKDQGLKRGGYPKLGQLYEALLGFGYPTKHDAHHDMIACFHVYKALKRRGYA